MLLNISFHFNYFPLFVVAAVAWGTPILLSVLKLRKIPSVIMEIIIGYFVGRYILVSVDHESFRILEFFALTGFIFLMFLAGLEIDVDQILASLPRKKLTYLRFISNPLLVGITYFMGSLVLAVLGAAFLSRIVPIKSIWYFALIMVTTSVGIVLPVLKDKGETKNRYGQMIVVAAAVADIFSIVLFTFTVIIIKNGFQAQILYIVGLFVLFILFYILGSRFKNVPFFKKHSYQLSHASSQIGIRGSFLLVMLFVVLAQLIGEEVVLLGAFLMGLVLSSMMHRERSVIMLKLDGMGYGFFIPIFFIMVGAEFDPAALKEFDQSLIWFLVLLLVILFAVKFGPGFLWQRLFGARKAIAGGFLMSSRLSLIIAAAAIGLEIGVITPGINASFIIMAIITCLISPMMFNWILPTSILSGDKTIIIGGSSTAVLLARRLSMHGRKSIIVENNPERAKDIISKGLNCIEGDGGDAAVYEKLKLNGPDYVVVETGSQDKNHEICRILRNVLQHDNIITRSGKSEYASKLKRLGVEAVDVIGMQATAMESLILRPTTYHALIESFENFSVEEIELTNKAFDSAHLRDIPFHKNAILMMVKRGNNFFIPHGETYFRIGDVLHVFGTDTALEDTREKMK